MTTPALPKAELHCHLEGALHLPTLWELAQRHEPRRFSSFKELRAASTVTAGEIPGFLPFLAKFDALRFHYGTEQDIYDLVSASIRALSPGVCYREIRFSPVFFARRLQRGNIAFGPEPPPDSVVEKATDAVANAVRDAMNICGAQFGLFLTCSRHFGYEVNAPALRLLNRLLGERFHGLDLAGDEALDASDFVPDFLKWRDAGKMITIHAGEDPNAGGPRNIVEALEVFKAHRIGHGVRAIEDSELVKRLADKRIPLELCPTSNLQTRAVTSEAVHPLKQLFDAGVNISISTDDPTICGTSLDDEYEFAARLGMSERDLKACTTNAIRAGVLSSLDKDALINLL